MNNLINVTDPQGGDEGVTYTAYITGAGMVWLEKYLNKNY